MTEERAQPVPSPAGVLALTLTCPGWFKHLPGMLASSKWAPPASLTAAWRGLHRVRLFRHLAGCPTRRTHSLNVYWILKSLWLMATSIIILHIVSESPKLKCFLALSMRIIYPFDENSWLGAETGIVPPAFPVRDLESPSFSYWP